MIGTGASATQERPYVLRPGDRLSGLSSVAFLRRYAFRILITCQLVVILGLGLFTVFNQPFYARVDERAGVSYIEFVADNYRLPVFGQTCVQTNLVGLQPGYPGATPGLPCNANENAASYEAFQPPLFYVAATPIWRLPLSLPNKIRAERLFCLFIFALTILLIGRFVRREFGRQAAPIFSFVLAVFLMPGVIMRSATVENGSMEVLMATVFLITLWSAARTRRPRAFVVSGLALGLALLTKTTLIYLIPLYLLVSGLTLWPRWHRRQFTGAAVGLLVAGLVVTPWLAFNESHFGTLTADNQAKALQTPSANPQHRVYTLRQLPSRIVMLADIMPEEWEQPYSAVNANGIERRATAGKELLGGVLIGSVIVILCVGAFQFGAPRRYLWFVTPTILAVGELAYVFLVDQWDILTPRFLYPTLAPLAIALAVSLLSARNGRKIVGTAAVLLSVAFAGAFVFEARHGLGAKCCVSPTTAAVRTGG